MRSIRLLEAFRLTLTVFVALGAACDSGVGTGPGAPVPTAKTCAPDGGIVLPADPAKPRVVTDSNGAVMADVCDGAGNLIKASCVAIGVCDPNDKLVCSPMETGLVEAKTIDCAGLCVGGACASGCPRQGDALTITSTDGAGSVAFSNRRDQRHYACVLLVADSLAADCAMSPVVGDVRYIVSLGLHDTFCTGRNFANLSTGPTEGSKTCNYTCDVAP
jgi:hypothetical protein